MDKFREIITGVVQKMPIVSVAIYGAIMFILGFWFD